MSTQTNNFKYGSRSKGYLYGTPEREAVKPPVVKLCELALSYSTVDFGIIDGLRYDHEQVAIFKAGNSELDGINKKSDHQYGMAIDVYPVIKRNGVRLDAYDVDDVDVRAGWLEVYRAFMRAAMKLGLIIEFGLGYNIGGGRDWPHISVKGKVPDDWSGLAIDID